MANRFPLIVNPATKKIEELVSGDNIDLTNSGLVANNTLGDNGQYLKSNGSTVVWDNPGDVYLTATQTVTNKTFNACILSGSTNTFSNIPNTALVNSGITINGVTVSLGGSVTTPDNNTTYSISAVDGLAATEKIIRLTSGGNSGSGVTDDVSFIAGSNVTLSRTGDAITINSNYVDTNTITSIKSAVGGNFVTGEVTIAATGSSTVSQTGNTITINSTYVDTITRLRVSNSGTLASGDFTFLQGGATTITDSGTGEFTISSQDTITRVRGTTSGTYNSGDITVTGSGATTVSQSGTTITVSSTDTNTVTRVRGTTSGTYNSGDITITGSGAATVSQTGTTINISATDTNTTYTASSTGGLSLSSTEFSIKNAGNLVGSKLIKWDSANAQVTNSIIEDNGSAVTIAGDLTVTGVTTTIDTANLRVADNEIELRKGIGLQGSNGGLRLNRTTDGAGSVQTWTSLQWFETGGYWRTYDGSVAQRLVTEGEVQTLTNKTLTSPTLTSPSLGIATATTINGVAITNAASATLTIANNKTFTCNNTLTFSGTDSSNVAFGNGGTVAYTSNTLSVFASTSSTQLRGIINDETGIGQLVFNTNPIFSGSIGTTDTSIAVFNTAATGINAFGAATQIVMGATSGTTTIRHNVDLDKSVTLGSVAGDAITVNGTATFANDFTIQGIDVGRGANSILGNMRIGQDALFSNTTGSQNTMVGYEAGYTINSGAGNVAIGYDSLHDLGTGQYNIAIGRSAVTNMLTGGKNVGIGANTLEANTTGDGNVCIGHYAGAGCTGTGNVLIGPADDENITNSTYRPPTPTGNRQLVIGSGTGTWIRGDSGFNVTFLQDVGIGGSVTIGGNLTVSGTTTTIDSTTIRVDDKNLELGDVQSVSFTATVTSGSSTITGVSSTANLIPGMVVSISTAGLSVPVGTEIATISGNTMTLTNPVTGNSGTATFNAVGPSDTSANGGGLILKGTTDKTLLWDNDDDAWTSSEHMDLVSGKAYKINGTNVLTATALGSNVTGSSLTSLGTLTSLTVSGNLTVDTNTLVVDSSNNRVSIGDSSGTTGTLGKLTLIGNQAAAYSTSYTDQYIYSPHPGELYIANTQLDTTGSFAGIVLRAGQTTTDIGINAARIAAIRTAAFTTDLAFQTRTDANGMSEKFRITNLGDILVNNSSPTHSTQSGSIFLTKPSEQSGNPSRGICWAPTSDTHYVKLEPTVIDGLVLNGYSGVAFATGSRSNSTWAEQARITTSGLQFAAGKGIDFSANANAAGMTSELLDDYEEGTWTPRIGDSSGVLATANSANAGSYTRIGNRVLLTGRVQTSSVVGVNGSSTAFITGLPFTIVNNNGGRGGISVGYANGLATGGAYAVAGYGENNDTRISLTKFDGTGGVSALTINQWSDDGDILFSFMYETT